MIVHPHHGSFLQSLNDVRHRPIWLDVERHPQCIKQKLIHTPPPHKYIMLSAFMLHSCCQVLGFSYFKPDTITVTKKLFHISKSTVWQIYVCQDDQNVENFWPVDVSDTVNFCFKRLQVDMNFSVWHIYSQFTHTGLLYTLIPGWPQKLSL